VHFGYDELAGVGEASQAPARAKRRNLVRTEQ
jgi:hypothetical protein